MVWWRLWGNVQIIVWMKDWGVGIIRGPVLNGGNMDAHMSYFIASSVPLLAPVGCLVLPEHSVVKRECEKHFIVYIGKEEKINGYSYQESYRKRRERGPCHTSILSACLLPQTPPLPLPLPHIYLTTSLPLRPRAPLPRTCQQKTSPQAILQANSLQSKVPLPSPP